MSTTNTYYIKSAADDTRVAMAKLEKCVIGKLDATTFQSGNTCGREPNHTNPVNALFTVLNLVVAAGLEPATYGF